MTPSQFWSAFLCAVGRVAGRHLRVHSSPPFASFASPRLCVFPTMTSSAPRKLVHLGWDAADRKLILSLVEAGHMSEAGGYIKTQRRRDAKHSEREECMIARFHTRPLAPRLRSIGRSGRERLKAPRLMHSANPLHSERRRISASCVHCHGVARVRVATNRFLHLEAHEAHEGSGWEVAAERFVVFVVSISGIHLLGAACAIWLDPRPRCGANPQKCTHAA